MNKEWVGTVDANDTNYVISADKVKRITTRPLEVSIEAFDYDGETSKNRTKVRV